MKVTLKMIKRKVLVKKHIDGKIESGYWENDEYIKDYRDDYPFSLKCIKTLNNHSKTVSKFIAIKRWKVII